MSVTVTTLAVIAPTMTARTISVALLASLVVATPTYLMR
jgi:hypothetical protein